MVHIKKKKENLKKKEKKTTVRYHCDICQIWLLSKRPQMTNVGEDVEKREPSYTVGGNVNWCSHCGKQYGSFSKN